MAGGVSDGQPVSAAVTDPAFIFKNADDQMPNKLDFTNNDPISGPSIINTQRNTNSLASFLGAAINGVYNLLPTWATNNRGSSSNNVKQRVEAIDTAFDGTTGHKHTGGAGDAAPISALTLSNVPLTGYGVQGVDITGVTGSSSNVTTQFTGYTPSNNTATQGAVVNAPYNKGIVRNASNDAEFVDAFGNTVYSRLTESSGTWTLSYYSEIAGVETVYSFVSSSNVRFYWQLLSPVLSPTSPVYSSLFFVPSENATADVITATTALQGKTQLSAVAPAVIAATGAAGTPNASVANADHTHEGLHSISKSGSAQIKGDATITQGTGVTITQVGNDIKFDVAASGGGGGSLQWIEGANAPVNSLDSVFNQIYSYSSGLSQNLYAQIRVPSSYTAGKPVKLYLPFYSPDSSGNALMQTVATLNRSGTDAFNNTTNQRTSTNTAVTLSGGTVNKFQVVTFDLTDTSGQINGVAVSAGDTILVKLTRGSDTATSDLEVTPFDCETSFT